MFIHLHVHSYFSFLEGGSSPEVLCETARALGCQSLALTDTNGLYGAMRFLKACRKNNLHPIFGAQITTSLPARWQEPYALVLAKDNQGYSELCRLITSRQLDADFELAQALASCTTHVLVLVSTLALAKAIKQLGKGQGLYLAIQDQAQRPDQGRLELTIQQASQAGVATVFTHPVYFATEHDHIAHKACRAIGLNTTLERVAPAQWASAYAYLQSPQRMQARLGAYRAVWERTLRIARTCHGRPQTNHLHFPHYPFAKGSSSFYFLSRLCFQGLRQRLRTVTSQALSQLAKELSVIEARHYEDYFLIVWDIVKEAKRRGIPTVGRGSAANSLVSYCLGITHVDPLKHGLFFERFLNPERIDPPDIDVDFPWDQRDEMLGYAYERFGKKQVAMLCSIVYLHARSAIREAGRLLGLTEEECSGFCKRLPYQAKVEGLEQVIALYPEARTLPIKEEPWRSVLKLAAYLDGLPRHLSVHPGGIIILDQPISTIVPKQMSEKGIEVTQYDMNAAEDAGLIKIDLLGQRGLAVIRDVARSQGVDWKTVDPEQDEPTKALIREGQTMGCFYVESPGMRLLLKKLRCDTFELLTTASSAIRPGVSDSGMRQMFIERHLGLAPVVYAHPALEPLLKDTCGVMIFQEDVIKAVHFIAGMSLGEADKLRRCIGFKQHEERITDYKQRFMEGARERQVSQAAAEEIWSQIESFAGFAFCKAHSASYAQLSFQAAYLKVHYPAAFMAAVLSNQGGFYGPSAYVEESRRMGLTIKGPDVNRSAWSYAGQDSTLVMGLMAVEGLGSEAGQTLIREREANGPYLDLPDLLGRTHLAPEKVDKLIACGACDSLDHKRVDLYWQLIIHQSQRLPGTLPLALQEKEVLPDLADMKSVEKFQQTYHQMRVSPGAHPLVQYREQLAFLKQQGMINANALEHHVGRLVLLCGWLVTAKGCDVRKTGQRMKFLTLEDFTAIYEVTLFPDVYNRDGHKLSGRGPYLIEGVVDNDHGGLTVTARRLGRLGL